MSKRYVAVTSPAGSKSAHKADWSALKGRKVIVWPDHDEPGRRYGEDVTRLVTEAGAQVAGVVDTATLFAFEEPTGQDAADLTALPDVLPMLGENPKLQTPEPVGLEKLLTMDMPAREWLLEGFIQARDLAMLHAYRGLGKSRVAHGIAIAVASGGQFLRWRAPQARNVLILDGELPREELQKMLAQAVSASDKEPSGTFRIFSSDLFGAPIPRLCTEAGQEIVNGWLDGVSLMVLDSVATLGLTDGRENDPESWASAQRWLLSIRRRGVAVLLVHHDGKAGVQRGTSAREDVLSTVVQLKRPPDYSEKDGLVVELAFTKARSLLGDSVDPIEARLQTNEDGRPVWTWRTVEDARARLAKEFKENGMTQREIAQELGCSVGLVNKLLKQVN